MNTIELNAKTLELAIKDAESKLGASKENLNIEVIQEASKGFLGLGAKSAVIKASVKYDAVAIAVDFIKNIAINMNIDVELDAHREGKHLFVNIKGEHMGAFIGKKGQTLDSLEYITSLMVNKASDTFINVNLDTENYRERRREGLERLALATASRVKKTNKAITLDAMNKSERRIVHSILHNDRHIATKSVGLDPYKTITIMPKRYE